ncbi:MAG TPA: ketoacyl-ACP synthase III family protein [Candidatus Kapabacteria bacterium]|nr:ketoacyl-ACP synthase III family protein [Candidatus Kapabacteria bacterium]
MEPISLQGVASYLPDIVVDNDFFRLASGIDRHPMFRGTHLRHHIDQDESATSMAVKAIRRLADKLDLDVARDVDVLITNVTLADLPFVGCGAAIAGELNLNPRYIYDLQNGGCVSFIFMLELAQLILQSTPARSALLCNLQTAAGRIFSLEDNRKLPQSCVPGDGCGVAYVTREGNNPVIATVTRTHGNYANDMDVKAPDGRHWWQPGTTAFNIDFDESKIASIVARGNRLVPEALNSALKLAGLGSKDVDFLVTNQPNRIFLRNWRESVQLREEQHIQTLADHGNLFGAASPICLERGIDDGRIHPASNLLLGGFSHAGDYSAAAIVRWNG